jgi:cytochrome P450
MSSTVQPLRFPVTRSCPFHPPQEYAQLRETDPISKVELPTGRTAWVVAKHDDVRRLLADPRVSSDRANPNFPLMLRQDPDTPRQQFRSLISMDPPEHTGHRRSVVNEFTVKRMRALRPRIQEIVDSHIDAMLAGPRPADLVQALSLPVPSLVICELLGVPYTDHDFFQSRTKVLVNRTTAPEERTRASRELRTFLDSLVTQKENEPTDDLVGRLVVKCRETGVADHEEIVGLATLLLVAGHETTANMISLSTVALLENPSQLTAVREDPTLLPQGVEELLRYFSIADQVTARVALEDIEIGGVRIRAGEGIIMLGLSANWDQNAFENPEKLDIRRGARHHVAFGYGPHQCLGQNLARIELEIVLETLFRRIPGLQLAAGVDELAFKTESAVYGVTELPVTW